MIDKTKLIVVLLILIVLHAYLDHYEKPSSACECDIVDSRDADGIKDQVASVGSEKGQLPGKGEVETSDKVISKGRTTSTTSSDGDNKSQIKKPDNLDVTSSNVYNYGNVSKAVRGYPQLPKRHLEVLGVTMHLQEYNFHQCLISKSMETAGCAVMCYMSDAKTYGYLMNPTGRWMFGSPTRPCYTKNKISHDAAALLSDVNHYVVVRHPIPRLVSGFIFVCRGLNGKCYGCSKDDFACFVERNYEYMKSVEMKERKNRLFELEYHFYPQYWFCGLEDHPEIFNVVKYSDDEAFAKRYMGIYRENGFPPANVQNATTTLQQKRTVHVSSDTAEESLQQILYENRTLLQLAVNTYFRDFEMFQFQIKPFEKGETEIPDCVSERVKRPAV